MPCTTIHSTIRLQPRLRVFSCLTTLMTFVLIFIGGKVTSFEFGMAIETGWTTGGWLSFFAPLEYWFHDKDKFWEHTHRMMGSLVGMLTVGMFVWLLLTQRDRLWLKWAGLVMLLMVGFQGYLGATRVDENSLTRAFIHGIGGQLILCGWVVITAALGRHWLARLGSAVDRRHVRPGVRLRWGVLILLVLLFGQLTLGSAVRHFKADKAIPDFPLVFGHVFPPMSQASLDKRYVAYYTERASNAVEAVGVVNRTPNGEIVVKLADVDLQYAHRLGAIVVCVVGLIVIVAGVRSVGYRSLVFGPALALLMLLCTQFALGVITVATETDPVMATLHQATGALLIAVATWLAVRIHLAGYQPVPAAAPKPVMQNGIEHAP